MASASTIVAAIAECLAAIPAEPRIERVPFAQALHRLAGEAVVLAEDRPAQDLAAVAGYAVRADERERELRLAGTLGDAVGAPPVLRAGTAWALAAGAPLPSDAAVLIAAEVDALGDRIRLRTEPAQHPGRRLAAGSLARAGTRLLDRGQVLDPAAQALAGWAGLEEVAIIAPPRCALLAPAPLIGGDALGPLLMAFCLGWNLPASRHRLPGEGPLRRQALANAADRARVVVACADGAACADAERALGFAPVLAPLAIARGQAAIACRPSGVVLVDLPADPAACLAALHLVLWPVLARLQACPAPVWRRRPLAAPWAEGEARTIVPARIDVSGAEPLPGDSLPIWTAASGMALRAGGAGEAPVLPWAHRGR